MSVVFHEELVPYLVPIDSIRQHPDNPNNGNVDVIVESILANGFYAPLVVQASTGYILAGNHRYAALLSLGETQAPVIRLEVDDTTALKVMLVDNRAAELAERDPRALEEILKRLAEEESLLGTGYMDEDLGELMRLNRIADHAPLKPDYEAYAGADGLPKRSMTDVRVVVSAKLDEDGRRHPMTKEDAEDLVNELREMDFEARGEFLG